MISNVCGGLAGGSARVPNIDRPVGLRVTFRRRDGAVAGGSPSRFGWINMGLDAHARR
jgi:hypothetical protein